MISLVCVYNDPEKLRECLLKGLSRQTAQYELISIDNTTGQFPSAATALNHGGARANGDYVAFIHQDVQLLSPDWLKQAEQLMRQLPDVGVAGVAGVRKPPKQRLLDIASVPFSSRVYHVYHGVDQQRVPCPEPPPGPCEVQTVDEQLLIVPRDVVRLLPFDEHVCFGWDLYGVEYSLSVKRLQRKPYVLPLPVWHFSPGRLTPRYFATLRRVLAKHQAERLIGTTCGIWDTSVVRNCVAWSLLGIRSELGHWLGRNASGGRPFFANIKALITASKVNPLR